jgi:predicted O-linked N-acetylglucosamine transferase (SPINDLY family)
MRSVPLSLLWLLKFPKEAESHLIREFKTRNIATTRLHLSDKFASDVHLNVKRGASILLDTLEYNAHVSGLDALWAGLPLVTMAGAKKPASQLASRGYSLAPPRHSRSRLSNGASSSKNSTATKRG